MDIKSLIKRIVLPNTYSEEAYIRYLRSKKILVGDNVKIWSPNHTFIDDTKPYLIKIGNNVKITQGVSILAHDYSRSVLRRQYGIFKGGTLPVNIGDNVFIGYNTTILMGTTIGNNSIIGANSLVKGVFPDNSVIAGNPARVICTIDKLWEKESENWVKNAKIVARQIYINKGGVMPTIEEMSDAYVCLYLPRTEENINKYKKFFALTGDDFEDYKKHFMGGYLHIRILKNFLTILILNNEKIFNSRYPFV